MSPGHMSCLSVLILSVCTTVCSSSQLLQEICVSHSNCLLQCWTDNNSSQVQSSPVTWYKVEDISSPGVSGRVLLNSTNTFDEDLQSHRLLIPDVTCSDAGLYTCQVTGAEDGEKWLGRVLLTVTDCSDEKRITDFYWLILASAVLMMALLTFFISNLILKNLFNGKKTSPVKNLVTKSPFTPLDQQELKSVHTLGSKTCSMNHVWV